MLEVRDLSSGYPDLPVLFDVNLRVDRGTLVSVLGGNGSGKSTLLKTILGDVSIRVSSGEILFAGERVTHLPAHKRVAAGITFSPEGRRALPTLTVEENLIAGSYGISGKTLHEQFALVYDLFPVLAERRNQKAGLLSGGEQQMLAIGRALMARPVVLLVDELSLGLAPIVVTHIYRALRGLCERGLSVLIAEQFQRFPAKYSDAWFAIQNGTVVAGSTAKG